MFLARSFKLIKEAEMRKLVAGFIAGDDKKREDLILSYRALVAPLARKHSYSESALDYEDYFQFGMLCVIEVLEEIRECMADKSYQGLPQMYIKKAVQYSLYHYNAKYSQVLNYKYYCPADVTSGRTTQENKDLNDNGYQGANIFHPDYVKSNGDESFSSEYFDYIHHRLGLVDDPAIEHSDLASFLYRRRIIRYITDIMSELPTWKHHIFTLYNLYDNGEISKEGLEHETGKDQRECYQVYKSVMATIKRKLKSEYGINIATKDKFTIVTENKERVLEQVEAGKSLHKASLFCGLSSCMGREYYMTDKDFAAKVDEIEQKQGICGESLSKAKYTTTDRRSLQDARKIAGLKQRKPVLQVDMDGKLIKRWNSVYEAADHFGVKPNSIRNALPGGQRKSCCGYKWMKEEQK